MSNTTAKRVNVGKLTRLVLRQAFGTQKGQAIIDLAESGLLEAADALRRRDFGGFLAAIPEDVRDALYHEALRRLGRV